MRNASCRLSWGILVAACGALWGCAGTGHFELFGYTTAPTYDCSIQTVYVPIFENASFRRGLEFDLTRAVIREIEAKTPYRVVNRRDQADTELLGRLVNRRKAIINTTQVGETRESEVLLAVELQWRDLRPGRQGELLSKAQDARKEDAAPDSSGKDLPIFRGFARRSQESGTVVVQPVTTFVPELGGSVTSAEAALVDRLATQIVSMMELPW
ncbi:MAG: LPS assembly lipoprotein LptE [Gemmataceae bacterium]|nr:LPS assembly lipoprotein LptE [Gemmataceae bacterium]